MKGQRKVLAVVFLMILAIILFSTTVLADSGTPSVSMQQATTPARVETYGIGWGSLMLVNAGLAQGKNRKGLNWFLISLLLGPIATFLLVAFFPKLPEAKP